MRNDLRREPVAFVAGACIIFIHAPSIAHPASLETNLLTLTLPFGAWSPSTRTGGQGQLPLFVLDDVG